MAFAQTITTGDVVGTVKDTTGAVVPGATVTLKSNDFGDARAVNTDGAGAFRFTFLKPGNYTVGALRRRVENRSPKAGGRMAKWPVWS
jgi:protocatechuate 3,4-dioxygenase beta subunit